jgi:hypothetical protein
MPSVRDPDTMTLGHPNAFARQFDFWNSHPARDRHLRPVAIVWELVLTTGLVSVILGTASGAQQVGSLSALGVGSFIALAGLVGAPSAVRR